MQIIAKIRNSEKLRFVFKFIGQLEQNFVFDEIINILQKNKLKQNFKTVVKF